MNTRFRGPRSTFMRRFARHSNLATVFRAAPALPIPAASIQASPAPKSTDSPQPVQATIIPEDTGLPVGHVLGFPPAPTPPPTQQQTPSVTPPTGTDRPPIQRASPPGRTTLAEAAVISAPSRQAESSTEEESSFGDRAWQRLQNIFNRHQQKETEPGDSPNDAPQDASPIQRKATGEPSSTQQAGERPTPEAPSSLEIQEPEALAEEFPIDIPPAEESPKTVESGTVEESQPATSPTEQLADPSTPTPESSHPGDVQDTPRATPEIPAHEDDSEPLQSLPLEAVWPVQRLHEPVRASSKLGQPPADEPTSYTPEAISPLSEEDESRVQRSLDSVRPGQPTDSAIEVIPPRRPRPKIQRQPQQPEETPESPPAEETPEPQLEFREPEEVETATEETQDDPLTTITPALDAESEGQSAAPQTQVSLRREAVQPVETPPDAVSEPAQPAPPEELTERIPADEAETVVSRRPEPTSEVVAQRQPESSVDSTPDRSSDPSRVVPTEVGPLPADLWTLIGETPPESTAEQVPTTRETVAPSRPMPPPPDEQPAIQRRVTETQSTTEEQTSQTEAERQPSTEESREEASEPKIDMDELSHKVYAEVRRRLTTEWERIRGRF